MNNDKYITIQELADLKGVSTRAIRMSRDKYITREIIVRGGKSFEILLSSIEPELQEKYFDEKTQISSNSTALIPIMQSKNLPTKANEIALARLDLLREWHKYRNAHSTNKTRAGIEFVESYNTGMLYPNIFKVLGKTSIGTMERWKRALGNTTDYHLLLPKYEYATEFRTSLTDYEKQVFLKILLHPNKFCVGKAISITKHILSKDEPVKVTDVTFRRYANWFRDNHYDIWTLARDGEKALKDNIEPYIMRDVSKIEVGDVLVADEHKLAFLVQNPFTGKPTRATLIGFLDWKSTALVGYEIMLEEKTQSIVSALRNSIINLQNIPKIVYQDNGRAFKAKYFVNTDFKETGFERIYARLNQKVNDVLSFTENAYELYLKGNLQQKKLILEIIAEDLTYKDKTLSVKLRPIFDCLSKSSIKLINIEFDNNRTLESMIDSELQEDKDSKQRKNSRETVTLTGFLAEFADLLRLFSYESFAIQYNYLKVA